MGLGVHQPLRAGVGLENGHQHDAAHPDGQNGIEGGHGAAVVCNGIHRLHGGLHHLGEVGAVILRAAAQDVQQGVQIVRTVAVLQAAQQAPQLVDGLAHGVAALGHKTVQGAGRRAGGCQQVPGIGCRSVEALEQALRLVQNVFHIIRHIAEHRRQQGVRQLLQLGHQSDGVLQNGGVLPDAVGHGVQPVPQLIAAVRQALGGGCGLGPHGPGLHGDRPGPGRELIAHIVHGLGGVPQVLLNLGQLGVHVDAVQNFLRRVKGLVQGCLGLIQGGVDLAVQLGHGVQKLLAVGAVLVDIRHQVRQVLAIAAVVLARGLEGVHGLGAGAQQAPGLAQQPLNGAHGVIALQLVRQVVGSPENGVHHHVQIAFADGGFQGRHRRVGDLGGHGVFLVVFIIGDGGLAGPLRQHVVHIIREVLTDDHGGVVIPGIDAVLGLLLGVHNDPVDAGAAAQVLHHLPALVDLGAVLLGPALIQGRHGDADVAGVAVGVPVGIDIQPGVQAGQHRDGQGHRQSKEMRKQRTGVRLDDAPDVPHTFLPLPKTDSAPGRGVLTVYRLLYYTLSKFPPFFCIFQDLFISSGRSRTISSGSGAVTVRRRRVTGWVSSSRWECRAGRGIRVRSSVP